MTLYRVLKAALCLLKRGDGAAFLQIYQQGKKKSLLFDSYLTINGVHAILVVENKVSMP